MAGAPSTYENIKDVPLYVSFNWRGQNQGTAQADAWAKNIFVEKDGDSEGPYSVKRPGLANVGSMTPAGFTPFNGLPAYAVQGSVALEGFGNNYLGNFVPAVIVQAHLMDARTGTFNVGLNSAPYTVTGGYALTSPGITRGGQVSIATQQGLTLGTGIGDNRICCVIQSPWEITTVKWNCTGNVIPTGLQYSLGQSYTAPPLVGGGLGLYQLVPGIMLLDNTYYVMDQTGKLWASAIGDPTTWPAINYVQVDATIGVPVALNRLGPYLVAFGTRGTQLFYDAGNSPGAPIQAVQGGIFLHGMPQWASFTIAASEDSLLWLGTSTEGNLAVKRMTGAQIMTVSSESVERYLNAYFSQGGASAILDSAIATVRGCLIRTAGHEFFVLSNLAYTSGSAGTGGATLTYDLKTNNWVVWTQQTTLAYGEGAFRAHSAINFGSQESYLPDITNGTLYQMNSNTYQDNGQTINVLIQTDEYSWGNQRTKLIPATYPLLDTVNTTVNLSWTNDDYATFSTPQPINTSTSKKQLIRCGSTVQRAWQLTHTDNTPMRFYALEVEVVPGAL